MPFIRGDGPVLIVVIPDIVSENILIKGDLEVPSNLLRSLPDEIKKNKRINANNIITGAPYIVSLFSIKHT